jgi:GT2 family glycosyltransferase
MPYERDPPCTLSARIEEYDQAVIRLEADERLHPEAMSIVNGEFRRNCDLLAIYSDAWVDRLIAPVPAWDPELLEGGVFPDAPVFLRAGTPLSIDGLNRSLGDILREVGPSRSSRISLPLVRGDKPRTRPKSVAMIRRAVVRPLVSAVIPTRYRPDLLDRCLGGLSRQTDYPNLEVIIVDNGSTDLRYEALYKQYTQYLDLRVLRVEEAFNYSRLVNRGVREASGGIIMSLNDDVEAMDPGWLESLVDSALRPEIGVVGCRLLYGDGTLQHGGVTFGIGGVAAHLWKGLSPEEATGNPMVIYPSRRRAVTGACMAFRRNAFDMVYGFDESFAVAFNDLDFCLRLEARGLGILYRGDVVLTHHESQSRGADDASVARRRRLAKEIGLFRERWGVFRSDPYGSQAFDPTRDSGAVYAWLAADWPVRRGMHRPGPVLRDSPKDFSDPPVADPRI